MTVCQSQKEGSPALRFQQQQHHGIPTVPFAKRNATTSLYQPVVYVDCEMDPLALPFGGGTDYQIIQRRRKPKPSSCTAASIFLWILVVVALAGVAWYVVSTMKDNTRENDVVMGSEAATHDPLTDDRFMLPGNLVTRF